jgi:hypothetical protein
MSNCNEKQVFSKPPHAIYFYKPCPIQASRKTTKQNTLTLLNYISVTKPALSISLRLYPLKWSRHRWNQAKKSSFRMKRGILGFPHLVISKDCCFLRLESNYLNAVLQLKNLCKIWGLVPLINTQILSHQLHNVTSIYHLQQYNGWST